MRALLFVLGLLLGLAMADAVMSRGAVAPASEGGARSPSGPGFSATNRAQSEKRPPTQAGAEGQLPLDPSAPTQPAREHPFAFLFTVHSGYDTSKLPAEEQADPQFREILDRAVRAMARERMAPFALALGLNDAQFAALLDVNCEQAEAWRDANANNLPASAREAMRVQLSRAAEARLAAMLSPEQMERLAGLKYGGLSVLWTADGYASRGAPLPRERVAGLLEPKAIDTPRGRFVQLHEPGLDPSLPWLGEAQRRHAARLRSWVAAHEVVDSAHNVKVKDPTLRDMWPPE